MSDKNRRLIFDLLLVAVSPPDMQAASMPLVLCSRWLPSSVVVGLCVCAHVCLLLMQVCVTVYTRRLAVVATFYSLNCIYDFVTGFWFQMW